MTFNIFGRDRRPEIAKAQSRTCALAVLCLGMLAVTNCGKDDDRRAGVSSAQKPVTYSSADAVVTPQRILADSEYSDDTSNGAMYPCGADGNSTGLMVCVKDEAADVEAHCSQSCLDLPRASFVLAPTPTDSLEPTPDVTPTPDPTHSPSPEPDHDSKIVDDPANKAPDGAPWEKCPVYKMQYKSGERGFDCDDFALGFDWYCENKLGVDCYQIGFTGCKKGTSHAFNVVEKGPRTSSYVFWSRTTYCTVEPQTNAEISCWQAPVGTWIPPQANKDATIEYFKKTWDEDFCATAWQTWDDCFDKDAGEACFTKSARQCALWKDVTGCDELPTFKK